MMVLIFLMALCGVGAAWFGYRSTALYFYVITLLISVGWFLHHVTTRLSIQL
jgi:hypothetical protein